MVDILSLRRSYHPRIFAYPLFLWDKHVDANYLCRRIYVVDYVEVSSQS